MAARTGPFRALDAWLRRWRERYSQLRVLCRESQIFERPKPLTSGGFRVRTNARFNETHKAAIDECFHGSDGFERAKACVEALVAKYGVSASASEGAAA